MRKRLLVLSMSGIGNTILQSPIINELLDREDFIVDVLFGDKSMQSVFLGDKRIRYRFFAFPKSTMQVLTLIFSLWRNKYDYSLACFPANRWQFNFLPFLIGVKKRVIHVHAFGRLRTLSFLSNLKIESHEELHDVEQNLNLLRAFNIDPQAVARKISFSVTESNRSFAASFFLKKCLQNRMMVGIHAGCNLLNEYRRWPSENFIDLINRLNRKNIFCLLFVGPDEREYTLNLYNKLQNKHENLLIDENDLNNVAALIGNCRFFVNTDSGLGHIAATVGVDAYAIFGPAQWSRTAPYGKKGHYVTGNAECSPCLKYPFRAVRPGVKCPSHFKCLKDLSADQVYSMIKHHVP